MKFVVIAVRDITANVFGMPQFVPSVGSGIRGFSDAVNNANENNMLNKHPEDFELYQIGSYDDATGVMESCELVQIAHGKSMVISRS